jgi:hypothetical protein
MNHDALRQMIDERIARREKLKSQLDAVELEIRVLQEAIARLGGVAAPAGDPRSRRAARGESRDRALKDIWVLALRFIGKADRASLDDIMQWSDADNIGIKRNTLRSQLSIYAERGWVERVSDGVYRLTASGAAKCGFVPEAKNDEVALAATQDDLSSEGEHLFRDQATEA